MEPSSTDGGDYHGDPNDTKVFMEQRRLQHCDREGQLVIMLGEDQLKVAATALSSWQLTAASSAHVNPTCSFAQQLPK